MAIDLNLHSWAGGASLSSLNYGDNPEKATNGNPFRSGTQEYQQYNEMIDQGVFDPSATPAGTDPNVAMQQALEASMARATKEFFGRATEYDANNPFAFDEALATNAANTKFGAYYDQKLGDFLQGITTTRTRSNEDENLLLTQIQQDSNAYTDKNKMLIDRATRQAQEGAADAGLFDSGIAKGSIGEQVVDSKTSLGNYLQGQGRRVDASQTALTRGLQDLNLNESTGRRDINAARAFDTATEVGNERLRQQKQSEFERTQYLGPAPGENAASFEQRRFSTLGI